jgi:hypothetical protein
MSGAELSINVRPDGSLAAIHDDALAGLCDQGHAAVRRASHVEPVDGGEQVNWQADMSPVGGPVLGPYRLRSDALAAEVAWLRANGY